MSLAQSTLQLRADIDILIALQTMVMKFRWERGLLERCLMGYVHEKTSGLHLSMEYLSSIRACGSGL